jgi:hypothetical protein
MFDRRSIERERGSFDFSKNSLTVVQPEARIIKVPGVHWRNLAQQRTALTGDGHIVTPTAANQSGELSGAMCRALMNNWNATRRLEQRRDHLKTVERLIIAALLGRRRQHWRRAELREFAKRHATVCSQFKHWRELAAKLVCF